MSHLALFGPNCIIHSLKSSEKDDVVREMVDAVVADGGVDTSQRDAVINAILDREKLGSTGIGKGVAMPHVKTDAVSDSVGAIGISHEGIDYAAVDGERVHVVFMVVSPPEKAEHHLGVIRWIARIARHGDCVRFMKSAKSAADVIDNLEELGS